METPGKEMAMDRLIQTSATVLSDVMAEDVRRMLDAVMAAVNEARDGKLIADSERPVYELLKDFEARVYERALQLRVDATEAAFSPSEGSVDRPIGAEQGAGVGKSVDAAGQGRADADAVLRVGKRKRGAGR